MHGTGSGSGFGVSGVDPSGYMTEESILTTVPNISAVRDSRNAAGILCKIRKVNMPTEQRSSRTSYAQNTLGGLPLLPRASSPKLLTTF